MNASFLALGMRNDAFIALEGASGSPGPTADTLYRARNLYLGRTRA